MLSKKMSSLHTSNLNFKEQFHLKHFSFAQFIIGTENDYIISLLLPPPPIGFHYYKCILLHSLLVELTISKIFFDNLNVIAGKC